MLRQGRCHCGSIVYQAEGEPVAHALCHCTDCRRSAGAPMVAWAMFPVSAVTLLQGTPKVYASSENGRRQFCPECGTGLFYTNAVTLPNIIDVQSATLDAPDTLSPQLHVQVAERIGWMEHVHDLPKVAGYPGMS